MLKKENFTNYTYKEEKNLLDCRLYSFKKPDRYSKIPIILILNNCRIKLKGHYVPVNI